MIYLFIDKQTQDRLLVASHNCLPSDNIFAEESRFWHNIKDGKHVQFWIIDGMQ